jgi:hypothetical protein
LREQAGVLEHPPVSAGGRPLWLKPAAMSTALIAPPRNHTTSGMLSVPVTAPVARPRPRDSMTS